MTSIQPYFGARQPHANSPQGYRRSDTAGDSVSIRFAGTAKAAPVPDKDFIATLPLPYRMAIKKASVMAEASQTPIGIDKIVVAMLELVSQNFNNIISSDPAKDDANQAAIRQMFNAIIPEERLINTSPDELITILVDTLDTARLALAESEKDYKEKTKPSDKPGQLGEYTRTFLENLQSQNPDDLTPRTLVDELLRSIPATDIDPTVLLKTAVGKQGLLKIPTDFKMARVLLDQCVLENLTRDDSTASAGTSTALVVVSKDNVEALTAVQFTETIRDESPLLGKLLDKAADEAYYQNQPLNLQHLLYAMAETAARVGKNPEAMGSILGSLDEEDRQIRYALEALIPPSELKTMKPPQAAAIARAIANNMKPWIAGNPDTPLEEKPVLKSEQKLEVISKMAPDFKRLLAEFIPQERRDIYGFSEFMRNKVSGSAAYPSEYSQMLGRITTARRATETGELKQYADTPEEFELLLDQQSAKGVMTGEQKAAIQGLIDKMKQRTGDDQSQLRQRLQVLLNEMNWEFTEDDPDPTRARRILDESHYGMDPVKDKIVDYVDVLRNQKEKGLPYEGRILCLVGPPGTGKTSLALAAAQATGRKVSSVALGGEDDVTKIRGFHHTYKNSAQGSVVDALVEAGSMNPVLVFDEIDKLKATHRGDPAAAMLEVLDPKQNKSFKDNFLGREIPVNLSNSLIICTANNIEDIPEALKSRMDIIELPGYDVEEKIHIAQKHLVPQWREKRGLSADEFSVTDDAVRQIADDYTFEAGVRELERSVGSIADKLVKPDVAAAQEGPVRADQLRDYLGVPDGYANILKPEKRPPGVGRVNKLSVVGDRTGAVGHYIATVDRFDLEKPEIPGTLALDDLYKNLGEDSQDSANKAFRWVRHNLARLGIELPKGKKTVVNLASESGGKVAGDSAGAAVTVAMTSALTNRPIDSNTAMTGTITPEGRVHAIGGLDKKLRGAVNGGMEVVFCPIQNDNDFERMAKDAPGLYAKFDKLVLNEEDLDGMDVVATIEAAKEAAKADGKLLLVETERVEPVLQYTLLPELSQAEQEKLAKPLAFRLAPKFGQNTGASIKPGRRLNLVS